MVKQIPLTRGKFSLVDDEDYEYLMQWKWYFNHGYACRCQTVSENPERKTRKTIQMHRVINNTPDGMETDHINGDMLDNRKSNLRSVTTRQNQMNQHSIRGKSKYKGVSFHKRWKKYSARIKVNQRVIHIGDYKNEIDAAIAYNAAAVKHFGEFAKLNEV